MSHGFPPEFPADAIPKFSQFRAAEFDQFPGSHAEHVVMGFLAVDQSVVRLLRIEQCLGDDARIDEEVDRPVDGRLGDAVSLALHLEQEFLDLEDVVSIDDGIENLRALRCVLEAFRAQEAPKDRAQGGHDLGGSGEVIGRGGVGRYVSHRGQVYAEAEVGETVSMEILAFQPWNGGSHLAVRRSIERHGSARWNWIETAPRGPRWRLRLGAAELVGKAEAAGAFQTAPDLIFATGLLDAAQLRGLLPPALGRLPLVLYMHENQAAYPVSEHVTDRDRDRDAHLIATNIASLLAADLILWNSRFNLESCLEGAARLLQSMPGGAPDGWIPGIRKRSRIAWPPVESIPEDVLRNPEKGGYPDGVRVAWPHRWEHDKGPDELLELADASAERLGLRFVLLGERGGRIPPAMELFRERHGHRIDHDGWEPDRTRYLKRLAGCDWVLSTARHEFFGMAVVEAMQCGCLPWLPDRLSYPELLPEEARGLTPESPPSNAVELRTSIRRHLAGSVASVAVTRIEDELSSLLGVAGPMEAD